MRATGSRARRHSLFRKFAWGPSSQPGGPGANLAPTRRDKDCLARAARRWCDGRRRRGTAPPTGCGPGGGLLCGPCMREHPPHPHPEPAPSPVGLWFAAAHTVPFTAERPNLAESACASVRGGRCAAANGPSDLLGTAGTAGTDAPFDRRGPAFSCLGGRSCTAPGGQRRFVHSIPQHEPSNHRARREYHVHMELQRPPADTRRDLPHRWLRTQ